MKSFLTALLIFSGGLFFFFGCAATYQQDCRVYLDSEPTGADIWKEDYYIGKTPYVLHYTATAVEDERGYLLVPPLTIKKDGYKPYLLEMELDLEDGGYEWEGLVVLEENK